jgi:hypothetical protein
MSVNGYDSAQQESANEPPERRSRETAPKTHRRSPMLPDSADR